jgi:hypothetical protein
MNFIRGVINALCITAAAAALFYFIVYFFFSIG